MIYCHQSFNSMSLAFKNHSSQSQSMDDPLAQYVHPTRNNPLHMAQTPSSSSRRLEDSNSERSSPNSQQEVISGLSNTFSDEDVDTHQLSLRVGETEGTNELNYVKSEQSCTANMSLSSINYRKLLKLEVHKNQMLEKALAKQSSRFQDVWQLNQKLKQQNRLLQKITEQCKLATAHKEAKIKKIDSKILEIRSQCNITSQKQQILEKEILRGKKERKRLREENEKYRVFISAMFESVGILNGRRIDSMPRLWEEWKKVFQEVSLSRCILKAK